MSRILKAVTLLSVFVVTIGFILAGNTGDWRQQAREKIATLTHRSTRWSPQSRQIASLPNTHLKTSAVKAGHKSVGSQAKEITPGERIARHREMVADMQAAGQDPQAYLEATTGVTAVMGTSGISGFVYDSDGVTKLGYYYVKAYDEYGFYVAGEDIQADSSYLIMDLPPGNYYVLAKASGYIEEFYDNVTDWRQATLVSVADGQTTSGIDFALEGGKVISGRLFEADGSTPIADTYARFHLYDASAAYEWDYW